jgi:hypothetical protein
VIHKSQELFRNLLGTFRNCQTLGPASRAGRVGQGLAGAPPGSHAPPRQRAARRGALRQRRRGGQRRPLLAPTRARGGSGSVQGLRWALLRARWAACLVLAGALALLLGF